MICNSIKSHRISILSYLMLTLLYTYCCLFIFGCRMQTPHGALFLFGPSPVVLPVNFSDVRQNAFNFTSTFFLSPLSPFLFSSSLLKLLQGFPLFVPTSALNCLSGPLLSLPYTPPIPHTPRLFPYPPPCPPTLSRSPSPSSTSSLLVLLRVSLRYA